ncbi:MAG: hypothetical protein Q9M40_03670 [Sulfurimonas sp.]|nr:hypothetical protein [Sulfurimonas sp.]
MGILSLFSSKKPKKQSKPTDTESLFENYLDKEFYSNIVDNSNSMILYFFKDMAGLELIKLFLIQ